MFDGFGISVSIDGNNVLVGESFDGTNGVAVGQAHLFNEICGCQIDSDCNDSNACTTDVCNPTNGQCSNTAIVCDDNDACNGVESCDTATGCVGGTPLVCDDNDACNGLESCDTATGCVPATPLVCDDGQFCTLDSCNTATGCVFDPNPDPSCERVGGEFIGVDNSALLVAGFQANALWLLPAIAAIGIGVVVIRRIR